MVKNLLMVVTLLHRVSDIDSKDHDRCFAGEIQTRIGGLFSSPARC